MAAIVVYLLLSISDFYEYKCLGTINNLYKYSCKCKNKQHYKAIIEIDMGPTPEGLTENITM